jgi:3-hydroxybutyryl-CoA dehydrogenase
MFAKKDLQSIQSIGVCGAGTMGSGIAQCAAQNGFAVIQFDVNPEMLEKSRSSMEKSLQKLVEKQKISVEEKGAIISRVSFSSDIKDCKADIVIEAIVENIQLKQQLFDELALINDGATIFATNTSSLSVAAICRGKNYASRFAGMHFFNPATIMKLVEIIRAEHTGEAVIETLVQLSKQMNKTPVVCNDAPGFIVNHVARHYYLEALELVEKNDEDFKIIDEVMEATGFKMGPFRLMDLIGMDINYSVSNIVWEALGKPERLQPSMIQKNKVDANELGKKTGKGFYEY